MDTGPVQLPVRRARAGHVPFCLDEDRVAQAARLYLGTHDFASLRSSGSSARTSVRTVTRSSAAFLDPEAPGAPGRTLVYEVEADGFLYNMVRTIAGTLLLVGKGRWEGSRVAEALAAEDRRAAGPTAPPEGLFLVRVRYE